MTVYHIVDQDTPFNFPDPLWSVHTGRGEHSMDILEIFGGFDIETTNIRQIDGWAAYAYHMQVSLANQRDTYVYLFRKWDILIWFFDQIAEHYKTGEKTKLILWVANFSFEFQFIRNRLKWDTGDWDFFAKEERQPLKATYKGIEFREALTISGGNLDHLAKTYCKTQKLITYDKEGNKISDLDYSIERNFSSKLSLQEEAYCINDVVILSEFSQRIFNDYIRPYKKVPMTRTGMLMDEYKRELKELCKKRDRKNNLFPGTSLSDWMDYLYSCQPDEETYKTWFKYLFRGGYVHANAVYTDIMLKVCMKDITSHYPGRMNLAYYPVTAFKKCEFSPDLLDKKCLIMKVQFDQIRITTQHSIESKNKIVKEIGAKWDNGRLISADFIEVWLTELDYKIYQKFYKTPIPPTVVECYQAERGKLPPYLIDVLNAHYIKKNALKAAGLNKTQEYAVEKGTVNANYGATVRRIRMDRISYDNDTGWGLSEIKPSYDEEIRKLILLPQWGIWVTAHARYELLNMLYKLTMAGVIVVYMDTDSCKYLPSAKAEKIFKAYNNQIRRHLHNRKLRNIHFSDLAMFDNEEKGKPVLFKTLGAKRYIYEDLKGNVIATVAGMPKQSIYKIGKTTEEIFKNFSAFGYELKPDYSGKLTTKYRDEPHEALVGYPFEKMYELSSVALYKIPFTLTLSEEYQAYIEETRQERQVL